MGGLGGRSQLSVLLVLLVSHLLRLCPLVPSICFSIFWFVLVSLKRPQPGRTRKLGRVLSPVPNLQKSQARSRDKTAILVKTLRGTLDVDSILKGFCPLCSVSFTNISSGSSPADRNVSTWVPVSADHQDQVRDLDLCWFQDQDRFRGLGPVGRGGWDPAVVELKLLKPHFYFNLFDPLMFIK